jgi:hypothetical protein
LEIQKDNDPTLRDILSGEPQEFKQKMIDVIKAQRAKGLWNEN